MVAAQSSTGQIGDQWVGTKTKQHNNNNNNNNNNKFTRVIIYSETIPTKQFR
jgi:hypothetical protein